MSDVIYAILVWMAIACLIGMYYIGKAIGSGLIRFWNWTQGAYVDFMEE